MIAAPESNFSPFSKKCGKDLPLERVTFLRVMVKVDAVGEDEVGGGGD